VKACNEFLVTHSPIRDKAPKHLRADGGLVHHLLAWRMQATARMGFFALRAQMHGPAAIAERASAVPSCGQLAGLPDPRRRGRAEIVSSSFGDIATPLSVGLLCVTLPKSAFLTGKACATTASPL
jgi:hypothetical protein